MEFHPIDRTTWDRSPYFDHYWNEAPCDYNLSAELDVTELVASSRERGYRLYPVFLYLLAAGVNRRREFRTCFRRGQLGWWDAMIPEYTVFHPESETFSTLWTPCPPAFPDFYAGYLSDLERYGDRPGLSPKPGKPPNTFCVSCLPWVELTSFQLNRAGAPDRLLPSFTLGRLVSREDRLFLPLYLQVHHAVCDGFHACRFFHEAGELAARWQRWLD